MEKGIRKKKEQIRKESERERQRETINTIEIEYRKALGEKEKEREEFSWYKRIGAMWTYLERNWPNPKFDLSVKHCLGDLCRDGIICDGSSEPREI